MGFTPIMLQSIHEDKDQFRYNKKPIRMGFTPSVLSSVRSVGP
jgi:hypothetical protein